MPKPPLPDALDRFLREPNFAVVASLRPDGQPHTAATWYAWDGDRILLNMDDSRLRLGYLRHDPRFSLTVLDGGNSYRHVTLMGVVEELRDDEGLRDIDRLALHYLGSPYPDHESPRTSAWCRVERWHGWNVLHEVHSEADWTS
jgi:PPOX class probable F420-dependent enzyme